MGALLSNAHLKLLPAFIWHLRVLCERSVIAEGSRLAQLESHQTASVNNSRLLTPCLLIRDRPETTETVAVAICVPGAYSVDRMCNAVISAITDAERLCAM